MSDPSSSKYIYLIEALGRCAGLYKIGIANDIQQRMSGFAGYPFDVALVSAIWTPYARVIEDKIHQHFAKKRVKGEWFKLSRKEVAIFRRHTRIALLLQELGIVVDFVIPEETLLAQEHSGKLFNLFRPLIQLETKLDKNFRYIEFAKLAGLSNTIARRLFREHYVPNDRELALILEFFASQGMPVQVGDLFAVTCSEN